MTNDRQSRFSRGMKSIVSGKGCHRTEAKDRVPISWRRVIWNKFSGIHIMVIILDCLSRDGSSILPCRAKNVPASLDSLTQTMRSSVTTTGGSL